MTDNGSNLIMDEAAILSALEGIAENIKDEFNALDNFALIGIRTRGVVLAKRLQNLLEEKTGKSPAMGILDITLYRDDLSTLARQPIVKPTTLPFDVDDAKIVLVDDVIYTGRTARAALDEIADFGRPGIVRLAVLIDRGLREYPIHPDYSSKKLETESNQIVQVRVKEIDGDEKVVLLNR